MISFILPDFLIEVLARLNVSGGDNCRDGQHHQSDDHVEHDLQ